MRAGQTAARHQQILHAPWQQATVGNIVGPCIPSRLQILRLSAPGGVMGIKAEIGVVHHHIREGSPRGDIRSRQRIVALDPPGLPKARGFGTACQASVLEAFDTLTQEIHHLLNLPPQHPIDPGDIRRGGTVHPAELIGVDQPLIRCLTAI